MNSQQRSGSPNQPAHPLPAAEVGPNALPGVGPSPPSEQPLLDFDQLAGPHNEVLIRLGTTIYRLRRTRNGRLLLYK